MGMMSVATIGAPEFINVTSINPLISKCEIKVLYTGKNRNKSFIDKATATAIGQTLPGSPIVGYYRKGKEDFTDHGEQIIFDDEGMKINDLTRPYGFVPTNAKVWFQKFNETDMAGKETSREYLMTEGYLWTGQYEEAQRIYEAEEGNPQSMKLHEKTLQGHWSKDVKTQVDFFIINDAIIQNLCILGEDVEPCFEGANVTAPHISASFSKDSNFVTTLFTMMKELNETLKNEGGSLMDNQVNTVVDTSAGNDLTVVEKFSENVDKVDESATVENHVITEEFAKTSDDKKEDEEKSNSDASAKEEEDEDKKKVTEHACAEEDEDKKDKYAKKEDEDDKEEDSASDKKEDSEPEKKDDDEEDSKKKYALLEQNFNELQANYAALEESYKELVAFKNAIEDEKKDALINQFYMLSDEDKKDVIDNKSKYSLDDIEAKLSVICVRKKVNFDLESKETKVEESAPITFNLNPVEADNLPAWLKAVEATKNRNQ